MNQQIKIGHYILGKTIGSGAFAKVKTAKHDLTNLEVAIKIINKKKMKNKSMIKKVQLEIKILKFLNHPNIIKLYEVLDTTNDILVIMEMASRGDLYENIQTSLTQLQARFYFKQIVNGIEYIHRNHIVHRDLKPENILIDSNNLIKIGDFGLSNLMKDGKSMKTACGSPYYAAPEIVGQKKYEGTSVDIWSMGVILFALIYGSLPFDEDNITLMYRKIERGSYSFPRQINKWAEDLIARMLQIDPCKRITIPEIKVHPWMQQTVPIYMRIPDQYVIESEFEGEIDEEIFDRMKMLDLNFHDYSEQKIKKAIMKRDDQSFAIAYELMKSDKDRKLYAQVQDQLDVIGNTILEKIPNCQASSIHNFEADQEEQIFLYGKIFEMGGKVLFDRLLIVLKNNNIQFQTKGKSPLIAEEQFCVKCIYLNRKLKKQANIMCEEGEKKKESKSNKCVLKFSVQIYETFENKKMLDFHLSQGHPMVFFPIVFELYAQIENMNV